MLWLVNTRVWIRVSKHRNFPPKDFFLNNYCGYFIKEIPNGFPCLDTLIQTLGMCWWLVNTRVWIRVSKHRNFPPKDFFLNNYCGYFIKEIPNGFPCLDTLIQTLGMWLDFRKAKNTRLVARVFFLRFSTVSQQNRIWYEICHFWRQLLASSCTDVIKT